MTDDQIYKRIERQFNGKDQEAARKFSLGVLVLSVRMLVSAAGAEITFRMLEDMLKNKEKLMR